MKIDTTHIEAEVAELRARIAASPYTSEDSAAAAKALAVKFDPSNPEAFLKAYEENGEKAQRAHDERQLSDYLRTLSGPLMKVDTRYVVIPKGTRLVSPAGFAPDSRVYFQVPLAIHTDDVNKVPALNFDADIYDIDAQLARG